MGVILIIIGLVFGAYGVQYFVHAQSTSSAIHEIAGAVGIGFGTIMIALGFLAFSIGATRHAVARLERELDRVTSDTEARRIFAVVESQRGAVIALRGLADSGDVRVPRQVDRIVAYLQSAAQASFNSETREHYRRWVEGLPRDEEVLAASLRSVASLSPAHRKLFRGALDEIVKLAKGGNDRQRQLADHLYRLIEARK